MTNRDQNGELEDRRSQTEAVCILVFLVGLAVLVIGILPGLIMMFLEDL